MRILLSGICGFALLVLGCQSPASQPANQTAQARIADARAANDTGIIPQASGQFDYYLLTLSWSPEYCHGHPNAAQCDGSHPGFVVHGLWPQNNDGRWPDHCSTAPGLTNPTGMLDIMPDPRLVAHEWATHGTCTGLSAADYFHTIRNAYQRIHIPAALRSPAQNRRASADAIKQMFVDVNPGLSPEDIAISCHNRYLAGVSFCMSKSLKPIACQAVRDCNASSITIPAQH
jgi:ribonuclease T2